MKWIIRLLIAVASAGMAWVLAQWRDSMNSRREAAKIRADFSDFLKKERTMSDEFIGRQKKIQESTRREMLRDPVDRANERVRRLGWERAPSSGANDMPSGND